MSRGLGKLQLEILATLDDAKWKQDSYSGSGMSLVSGLRDVRWHHPGWITRGRWLARIAEDVYDLRASCRFIMAQRGVRPGGNAAYALQAAFSRAVRGLVDRGVLIHLTLVPVADWEDELEGVERLSDGNYIHYRDKQVRFVKLATLTLTDALGLNRAKTASISYGS